MGRWVIVNTFLALIVLLLAVEIARTWARQLPPVEVAVRAPSRPASNEKREKGKHGGAEKTATRAEQAPAVLVNAIVEKDLFDPSRQKPVEEAKVEVPKEIEPPKGVTVVGVSIVGKEREAFIIDTGQPAQPGVPTPPGQPAPGGASAGGPQRRVRVGDQVQSYTVKTINHSGLTLVSPSGDLVTMALELLRGGGAGGPKPGPAPRAPTGTGSPAAGSVATSPAAGVATAKPAPQPARPVPNAPAPGVPAPAAVQARPGPGMPADVQNRLQQLGERHGSRAARKR